MPSRLVSASKFQNRTKLDEEERRLLCAEYKLIHSEMKEMIDEYNQEKEVARKQWKLRSFPKFHDWIPKRDLTSTDEVILGGVSANAQSFESMFIRDSVGRKHLLQSSTIDDARKSHHFFIYLIEGNRLAGLPKFGRIACFFSHQYLRSYHFAKVKLFKDVHKEPSTGIWYAFNPEKSFEYSVISIDGISAAIPVDITDNGSKVSFSSNLLSLH